MKNILLVLAAMACIQVSAQRKPKIKGNKIVTDVQGSLEPFHAIELNDDLEIKLRKSSEEGYDITADDNLIDVLKFEVEDEVLVISSFYNITGKKKLEITVDYVQLDALTLNDGEMQMNDAIVTDVLTVKTFESAKLQLNAEASQIDISMVGNSSGDFVLTADEVNMELKDRIDVRIYTDSGTNNLKMAKNASVKMEGTVEDFKVDLIGNSSLKGERLEAKNAFLNLSESPSAEVNVRDSLALTSSGASQTALYGTAKINIIEFLDTSELKKKK